MEEIALGNIVESCGPVASHLVDLGNKNIWWHSSKLSVCCESEAAFVYFFCVNQFSTDRCCNVSVGFPNGPVGFPNVPVAFPNDSTTQSYLCLLQILGVMNLLKVFLETLFIYCWGLYYILHGIVEIYITQKRNFLSWFCLY